MINKLIKWQLTCKYFCNVLLRGKKKIKKLWPKPAYPVTYSSQFVEVGNKFGSVSVDKTTESQTVFPTKLLQKIIFLVLNRFILGAKRNNEHTLYSEKPNHKNKKYSPHVEILNINILIRSSLPLAPQQKTFLSRSILNWNILNSKSQNNSPNHTQSHLHITITDFFGTNWHQFDTLIVDEIQSFVDVGDFVESHLTSVGFGESFAGDDFEQEHEFEAVSEVGGDFFDAGAGFSEVGVAPCCEGLNEKGREGKS